MSTPESDSILSQIDLSTNAADRADLIKTFVRSIHDAPSPIEPSVPIDKLLFGDSVTHIETLWVDPDVEEATHPGEIAWNGALSRIWTPYNDAKILFKDALHLGERDKFYDLGAGYGRVPLYGAMVNPATFKGIEMVEARAGFMRTAASRLALQNAEVICSTVQEADFRDGTAYYVYDSFSDETFAWVKRQLRGIAAERQDPLIVAARNCRKFQGQDWLELVKVIGHNEGFHGNLYLYRSQPDFAKRRD